MRWQALTLTTDWDLCNGMTMVAKITETTKRMDEAEFMKNWRRDTFELNGAVPGQETGNVNGDKRADAG